MLSLVVRKPKDTQKNKYSLNICDSPCPINYSNFICSNTKDTSTILKFLDEYFFKVAWNTIINDNWPNSVTEEIYNEGIVFCPLYPDDFNLLFGEEINSKSIAKVDFEDNFGPFPELSNGLSATISEISCSYYDGNGIEYNVDIFYEGRLTPTIKHKLN